MIVITTIKSFTPALTGVSHKSGVPKPYSMPAKLQGDIVYNGRGGAIGFAYECSEDATEEAMRALVGQEVFILVEEASIYNQTVTVKGIILDDKGKADLIKQLTPAKKKEEGK